MKFILRSNLIWVFIAIPLLSYLVLKPSFNLSLFGDDWEQLYFMYLDFDVRGQFNRFDIKSYLGPYNFSYSYLGILNHYFGLNSAAYFYTSYLFRVLTTISIYFLVNFISKQKRAGFLASFFFIFTAAGLETTDWVFNMNTYLGIFLFNLSVMLYFKIRAAKNISVPYILGFILLFGLSLIVVATRLHGAVPFLILMDLALLVLYEKKILTLNFFFRIIIPILVLFFSINIGAFGHVGSGGFTDRLKLGFDTGVTLLQKGEYIFLFFLPGLIGQIVLPDYVSNILAETFGLTFTTVIFLFVIGILVYLLTKKKLNFIRIFIPSLLWIIIIFLIQRLNPNLSGKYLSILIGGETLIFMIWLFLVLRRSYPIYSFSILFSLFWVIAFTLIYWLFSPTVFFEIPLLFGTTSRYMTMGGIGFAIFFGVFLSFLFKNLPPKFTGIPVTILTTIIIVNFWTGHTYLALLEANRNSTIATSIWNSLISQIKNLDIKNPTVFYFTSDNPTSLYWNVVFGFPSHMGLTYKIPDLNNTPIPETDYPRLLEFVKDGSPLLKVHGRPIKNPVPIDHVFAFHLLGSQMIDQTPVIRKKILEDLKKY